MSNILLFSRLLLLVVFLVAGVAKLADRPGSRTALLDFGVPGALATPLGLLLPLTEIMVAIALVPADFAWWGALGALALLLSSLVGIGINIMLGRTPNCHCFGQLHSAPLGWRTFVRNGVLALAAGIIVWAGYDNNPGPSAPGWLVGLSLRQITGVLPVFIVFGLLIGEGWLLLHLLRQNGRLLLRIEALEAQLMGTRTRNGLPLTPSALPATGLPTGTPAPPFRLTDLSGATHTLDDFCAQREPVLLLFSDPKCGPCTALLPHVARWQESLRNRAVLVIVSRGTVEANRAQAAKYGLSHVLLQQDREVAELYRVAATPAAILIHADGSIGSAVAKGAGAIDVLVRSMTKAPFTRAPGAPAAAMSNSPSGEHGSASSGPKWS